METTFEPRQKIYTFHALFNYKDAGEIIQLKAEDIKTLLLEDNGYMIVEFHKKYILINLLPLFNAIDKILSKVCLTLEIFDNNEQLEFLRYFSGLRNTSFKGQNESHICELMQWYSLHFETSLPNEEMFDLDYYLQIRKKEKSVTKRKK